MLGPVVLARNHNFPSSKSPPKIIPIIDIYSFVNIYVHIMNYFYFTNSKKDNSSGEKNGNN